jgi:hypothetical protein
MQVNLTLVWWKKLSPANKSAVTLFRGLIIFGLANENAG